MFINLPLTLSLVLGCGVTLVVCSSKHISGSSLERLRRHATPQKRQAERDWCAIPPPMKNGRLRPSHNRCRLNNVSPACQMTPGTYVFPNWVLYLDYCDPGYVMNTTHDIAACVKGEWLPRLPTCGASNECVESETTVNDEAVCRGKVILGEEFNGPLDDDLWFKFNSSNDYGFIKNTYTRNGNLVMRLTVDEEANRCTSSQNQTVCELEGDTNVHPLSFVEVNTYKKFRFHYGKLEIRAKLPVGDWLVFELLLTTKPIYGHFGPDGLIRIVSIGNSDLQCNGEDVGLGRVEFIVGISIRVDKKLKRFSLYNLPKNWYERYHVFEVIWKPGSLSFKIDDETLGEISPSGKTLCEDFGYTQKTCSDNGFKTFTPFDTSMTMIMGLSAGHVSFFPDNCINRGKRKPWRQRDQTAVKLQNFFQDKENWGPTWTYEGSALYVDYVRVTAL